MRIENTLMKVDNLVGYLKELDSFIASDETVLEPKYSINFSGKKYKYHKINYGFNNIERNEISIVEESGNKVGAYSITKTPVRFKDIDELYILHHTDPDGFASAANMFRYISKHAAEEAEDYDMIYKLHLHTTTIDYNYNKDSYEYRRIYNVPNDGKYRVLIVSDISSFDLEKFSYLFDHIIWVDHHVTSLDELEGFFKRGNFNPECVFEYKLDVRQSAAYLTNLLYVLVTTYSDYLGFVYPTNFAKAQLKAMSLISVYDMKQDVDYPEDYQTAVEYIQYIYDMRTMGPMSDIWDKYFYIGEIEKVFYSGMEVLDDQIATGKKIYELLMERNKIMTEGGCSYFTDIDINIGEETKTLYFHGIEGDGNSFRFIEPEYRKGLERKEIKILFLVDGGNGISKCSVYTDNDELDINLGRILKKYFLGGGHPKAAGFRLNMEVAKCMISYLAYNYSKYDKDKEEIEYCVNKITEHGLKYFKMNFVDQDFTEFIDIYEQSLDHLGESNSNMFNNKAAVFFNMVAAIIAFEYENIMNKEEQK